jgi:hypothetical protein
MISSFFLKSISKKMNSILHIREGDNKKDDFSFLYYLGVVQEESLMHVFA